MIFRVLIERNVIQRARRNAVQIFQESGVFFHAVDLAAADACNIKRAVLEGGQGVVGRRDDLILPLVELNLRGVPIAVVLFQLNVCGPRQIFAQHKCAVRQESFGRRAVAALIEAVVKFFIYRKKGREAHKRGEECNRRFEFNDERFRVGRAHAQSRRVGSFRHGVRIFHTSYRIAHDV